MHNLVVPPLQEGGVDGAKGHEALTRQPSSKGHGVLLGNPHVKHASGELALKAAAMQVSRREDFRNICLRRSLAWWSVAAMLELCTHMRVRVCNR